MRYVIIGRSVAGISAAASVRDHDPASEIAVISGEKGRPYYRPMLPLLISGARNDENIAYPEDPFRDKNINALLGTAIGIDTRRRDVLLASGVRVPYDVLLLATGAAALKPAIPGIDGPGVYALRTLAHARAIREAAATACSVVVIGGGLVGVKTALALAESAGRKVTVVEALPDILTGRLDSQASKIIRSAIAQRGVSVLTGTAMQRVVRSGSIVSGVELSSGRTIAADIVIIAAGARPNVGYLSKSGIRTNRGVLVDDFLRTNVPGVFAAGDAAEGTDAITGRKTVSGLWTNAFEMGRVAGANMAGKTVRYERLLQVMNASEIAGVPFISVGLIEPAGGRYEVVSHHSESGYWKLILDRELLVGAVFVGDLDQAGIYTNLIRNRIPIAKVRDDIRKRRVHYPDLFANSMDAPDSR